MSIDVKQIPAFLAGWLSWLLGQIITWGVLLLIVAAILQRYGVRQSFIPTINVTELVWLCGAVWLARGGRIT